MTGHKPLFRTVLVANRGAVAVRIIQTLQEMGIRAVALASEADRFAKHVQWADATVYLPGTSPKDTYLNQALILESIKRLPRGWQVEAVHPGYGFLSENAAFAAACQQAGLTFIGPEPELIGRMGDKVEARAMMEAVGIPLVPGWVGEAGSEENAYLQAAETIGYPVLVKAAAGGGGKGMRRVASPEELLEAIRAAAREAQSAFGDARIFLEKYITRPRHVEFQILGDQHGHRVHWYERECSVQRRHQKVIEETPSPALNNALREEMAQTALHIADLMQYTHAGTIEFILDEQGRYYFLEVNTRLQVEHAITEATLQQDLVRCQVEVAAGLPLPFKQADIKPIGHAIECRLYAEDPSQGYLPDTGTLTVYRPPHMPGLRIDSGFQEGDAVTVHYDAMLAKIVTHAPDRQAAMAKMQWALSHFPVLGLKTNLSLLQAVLLHPDFQAGRYHTHFLEECFNAQGTQNPAFSADPRLPALLVSDMLASQSASLALAAHHVTVDSPWESGGAWRMGVSV